MKTQTAIPARIKRLRDAGVDFSGGEFTFSPCKGPDLLAI